MPPLRHLYSSWDVNMGQNDQMYQSTSARVYREGAKWVDGIPGQFSPKPCSPSPRPEERCGQGGTGPCSAQDGEGQGPVERAAAEFILL